MSHFKKLKNDYGDPSLIFAMANTDKIPALKEYSGKSQPTILFYGKDVLVNAIRGANSPLITTVVKKELEAEHNVMDTEGAVRVEFVDNALNEVEVKEVEKKTEDAAEPEAEGEAEKKERADTSQYVYCSYIGDGEFKVAPFDAEAEAGADAAPADGAEADADAAAADGAEAEAGAEGEAKAEGEEKPEKAEPYLGTGSKMVDGEEQSDPYLDAFHVAIAEAGFKVVKQGLIWNGQRDTDAAEFDGQREWPAPSQTTNNRFVGFILKKEDCETHAAKQFIDLHSDVAAGDENVDAEADDGKTKWRGAIHVGGGEDSTPPVSIDEGHRDMILYLFPEWATEMNFTDGSEVAEEGGEAGGEAGGEEGGEGEAAAAAEGAEEDKSGEEAAPERISSAARDAAEKINLGSRPASASAEGGDEAAPAAEGEEAPAAEGDAAAPAAEGDAAAPAAEGDAAAPAAEGDEAAPAAAEEAA